tara:strand:+ start:672 stop:1454 length:783 start_codon:yes stop_codon:yes gene_type:complete
MNNLSNYLNFLFSNFLVVFHLSRFDIKLKYKRTIIGDYWGILTNLIALGIISLIWSIVFESYFLEYFSKIFIGMTSFYMLMSFTSNSTDILYTTYKDDLISLGIPLNTVFQRNFIKILLEYLQLFPVYIIFTLIFIDTIGFECLLIIPGLILVLLNCYFISIILSIVCLRFRDVGLLIKSVMRAGVLLTPILWDKSRLGIYENYVYLNPFTSMIEALKNPLLGLEINYFIYIILIIFLLLNFIISFYLIKSKLKILPFWI